jgi:ADP-ribose pyrophosphatase YjhB (NUDIX family)
MPNGDPNIVHRGRLGAMVEFPVLQDRGKGYVELVFEKFCRPPGTRLIALRDNKILLNKERRLELSLAGDDEPSKFDWRLPGGKVFDSFDEYEQYLGKDVPEEKIIEGARKELQEEAHLDTDNLTIFDRSVCGSSVEWDLYYVVAQDTVDFHLKDHNEGEEIEEHSWFTFSEIESMCRSGEINEGRSVAVLMRFISQ